MHIQKGVYLGALILTNRNFATFNLVKDKATVDVHGYVLYSHDLSVRSHPRGFFRGFIINISAWASVLLVSTRWAMRRPRFVGRVTGTDSRASFFMCIS